MPITSILHKLQHSVINFSTIFHHYLHFLLIRFSTAAVFHRMSHFQYFTELISFECLFRMIGERHRKKFYRQDASRSKIKLKKNLNVGLYLNNLLYSHLMDCHIGVVLFGKYLNEAFLQQTIFRVEA